MQPVKIARWSEDPDREPVGALVDGVDTVDLAAEIGYDYITMGGGLVINRCGLVALLEANDAPGIDTPDDMWVGLCLKEMGVEVVHHEGFHQEPPSAYPPEVLAQRQAVSFHRHAPDNPDEVYARFLAQ